MKYARVSGFPFVRVLQHGPLIEVTTSNQVPPSRYYRSYTIAIPKGRVTTVWRDGRIVWDEAIATDAEFQSRVRFRFGETNRMSMVRDDLTDTRGRIPDYHFQMEAA